MNTRPHPANNTPTPPAQARGGAAHSHVNDDSLSAHRVRSNTRTPLEPIGYDSQGAPLWPWQVMDGE